MKILKSIFCLILFTTILNSGYSQDTLWQKTYRFGAFNNYDLRNSSTNAISTYRLLNDGFNEGIASKMNPKVANISKGIFNFATGYLTMLWSHEFGHSLRAKQVGGKFNIHNVALPFPYTTMDLPEDVSLIDEALSVTGGFEVNYLNIRNIQAQFIRQNGTWNEDLSLSFANRLMYTVYTSFVTPIDPKDANVWIETAGDPVHYILPVFKNYSDGQVFTDDETVNPELVSFYNEATIFATFFQLLDPQFYREVGAAFGDADKIRRPNFLIGDYENGWTYGTLFNPSPLGYELYLQNYIHVKGMQFGVYAKYGRPYKNMGLGLSMNDALKFDKFRSDILVELWDQDIFGKGVSVELDTELMIADNWGINFNWGYKTKGYVLGKQLEAGFNAGIGVSYYRVSR